MVVCQGLNCKHKAIERLYKQEWHFCDFYSQDIEQIDPGRKCPRYEPRKRR